MNNNNYPDLKKFSTILRNLQKEYAYLYKTKHKEGKYGDINFVVWSDLIVCDNCGNETPFLDLFVRLGEGKIEDNAYCPFCNSLIVRNRCTKKQESYFDIQLNESRVRTQSIPYLIDYTYDGHKFKKKPDAEDIELIEKVKQIPNNSWLPIVPLGKGDKMEDPKAKGIFYVHQLYTDRTLFILSKLWEKCNTFNKFYITNSISRNLTKLNRFIVNKYNLNGRINGPLSGTLYVPSEIVEQNVFSLLDSKHSTEVEKINFHNVIQVGDALHNKVLPSESVDYIFTDPPFGDNIMYSELNKISEAWLNVITNNTDEAIANNTQKKSYYDYGALMLSAFKDYYRVLKPGKWMTVEFSNTKASVWNAIQTAIQGAGFIISSVSAFDKVHGGIKSMRYTTSVKEDLIITCYKPSKGLAEKIVGSSERKETVWDFVQEHLEHLSVHIVKDCKTTTVVERSPKILYDRLISYYIQNGFALPIDAAEFQQGLRERFVERDGMFFTAVQAAEYEEKRRATEGMVPMGIVVDSEAEGIAWLKVQLQTPQTYQQIQPQWMQAINGIRKGDILPELKTILEENFIETAEGKWRLPNSQDDADMDALRRKALMREFNLYRDQALRPKSKLREVRVEAIREGLSQCYKAKDFATIVAVCNKIPENLLNEDPQILMFYNMAQNKI